MFYVKMFWDRVCKLWEQMLSQISSDPLERCRWIKFSSSLHSRSAKLKDQLARAGEEVAAKYLVSQGYTVLQRNVRFPEGELDFIAKMEQTLVFIEVKTRTTEKFGKPYQFVTLAKQRRQLVLARQFISLCRLWHVPVRFDIISIVWPPGGQPHIEHIENAFTSRDF